MKLLPAESTLIVIALEGIEKIAFTKSIATYQVSQDTLIGSHNEIILKQQL